MERREEATVIASAADARRLGRYVLLGDIAEGGMGRIYLARTVGAAGFEKLFAIKVMHQGLLSRNPDIGEMFLDEARINSLVRHPNVCAVHDFGEEAGVNFLVMELMVGQTLLEVLRRAYQTSEVRDHPLFWSRVARIVAEACEGLHAAHHAVDERGNPMSVVHRDISPENLFMTYNGVVKVFDFGIAKATGRRHETTAGTFKGKFPYASPEAFTRQGIDSRSDIWSMGVVLWELLAGRALFHRSSEAEVLGAVSQDPIPSVQSVRPHCPPELDRIITRLLERDPKERYQDARSVARDLNQFAIKSGEHLGHGELGEWMRALFPTEYRTAMDRGRSVARLDTGTIDAAPRLRSAPRKRLVSQVIPRHDPPHRGPPGLHSDPTVVHPDGVAPPEYSSHRGDSEQETLLVQNPPPRRAAPAVRRGAPSPFTDLGEEVTGEVHLESSQRSADHTAPTENTENTFPASQRTGAPSPFEELPPAVEVEGLPTKRLLWLGLKISLAGVALLVGIFAADLVFRSPVSPNPTVDDPAGGDAPSGAVTNTQSPPASSPSDALPPVAAPQIPPMAPVEAPPAAAPSTRSATAPPRIEESRSRATERSTKRHAKRPSRARALMETQATTGEPGVVNVFAVGGWADIYEGSRHLGRTPARLRLAPGRHTLTLRPEEGPPVQRAISVPTGGTVRVRVEL